MLLFIKYNLRAVEYELDTLPCIPDGWVPPNSRSLPTPAVAEVEQEEALSESDTDGSEAESDVSSDLIFYKL